MPRRPAVRARIAIERMPLKAYPAANTFRYTNYTSV